MYDNKRNVVRSAILTFIALCFFYGSVIAQEKILYFWHCWPEPNFPRNVFLVDKIKEFEERNPGSKIEQYGYTDAPFKIKLKTEMIAGAGPDIFFTWPSTFLEQFVVADKIYNLYRFFN